MAQIAATSLGVPLNRVAVTDTQTALIPNTPPTTMVATDMVGEAIIKPARSSIGGLLRTPGASRTR